MAGAIRIIVVDDHPLVRAGLASLLAVDDELEVIAEAGGGPEAVVLVDDLVPDVVLMDLSMPAGDGIEATRAITTAHPHVRVAMLTTFTDRERVAAALDAGASGYLLKDAEAGELIRAVHDVARGERSFAPGLAAQADEPDPLTRLRPREREVLDLVCEGLPNKRIARQLGISEKTVKAHLTRVYEALGVSDRTGAVLWARRRGLLDR
jgi:DNA-binding NarL/FixJ family response regulator